MMHIRQAKTICAIGGLLLIATACLSQPGPAQTAASPRYSIVDLGPLLAREIDEKPGLNEARVVAAWQSDGPDQVRANLLSNGRPTQLAPEVAGRNTYAFDVNAENVTVGIAESRQDMRQVLPFLWQADTFHLLPTLGGPSGSAKAINVLGQVAGSSQTASQQMHATMWRQEHAEDLGTLPGGDVSRGLAINALGEVAGESNTVPNGKPQAVIWSQGKIQPLGLLPGGSLSSALALNQKHEAVGFADSADGESRAVLWSGGRIKDLGSLGDDPNSALDINDTGQIVGTSALSEGKMRAFLWQHGHLFDLNQLIPTNSGWLLMSAYRITQKGEILVHGFFQGKAHLCLLVPIVPGNRGARRGATHAPQRLTQ